MYLKGTALPVAATTLTPRLNHKHLNNTTTKYLALIFIFLREVGQRGGQVL